MTAGFASIVSHRTPDAHARGFDLDSASDAQDVVLTRACVGGRFSLIDDGPMAIATVPGLMVLVHSGALRATHASDCEDRLVRAGDLFRAEAAGLLVISALERGEVEVAWPSHGNGNQAAGTVPKDRAS